MDKQMSMLLLLFYADTLVMTSASTVRIMMTGEIESNTGERTVDFSVHEA
jgi:hypothetical protein